MSRPVVASLPGLVAARALDGRMAALAWLLLERGVPALAVGRDAALRAALLDALTEALPPERRPVAAAPDAPPGVGRVVRLARVLDDASPVGVLHAALAVTSGRSGLVAAIDAEDLAGALAIVRRQGLSDDEASFLGAVLVLGQGSGAGAPSRVVTAHYLRPLVLDAGGHPRRLAPAVLGAWDPRDERWEDFSWGIVPDLADRAGMRAADFDAEVEARAARLAFDGAGLPDAPVPGEARPG